MMQIVKFFHELYEPVVKVVAKYDSPKAEAFKSVIRMGIMLGLSWLVTDVLRQLDLVPESHNLKVWVFSFIIPVRASLFWSLTAFQKWLDKWVWEKDNNRDLKRGEHATGILP